MTFFQKASLFDPYLQLHFPRRGLLRKERFFILSPSSFLPCKQSTIQPDETFFLKPLLPKGSLLESS